jgi:sulfur carrier protein ThiS adenylyltransferase
MSISDQEYIHYSRQIMLPEFGEQGQQNLKESRVAIVGIGGLGQLCCQYLAAAGVGRLTVIDGDNIEVSNLPRQLLFDAKEIGANKASVSKSKLEARYPQCQITAFASFINADNATESLLGADIVLDCSDNFETRHLVNASCVRLSIPCVMAGVAHFNGQLLSVDLARYPQSGCYHCLFPRSFQLVQNCATEGVLGPMVGIMASMQALLVIKSLAGILNDKALLYRFDGLGLSLTASLRARDPACPVCAPHIKERGYE